MKRAQVGLERSRNTERSQRSGRNRGRTGKSVEVGVERGKKKVPISDY